MTSEEKQEIIAEVLAALRTNSKTIAQLTAITQLSNSDYFEVSGGRRVSYANLISGLVSTGDFETAMNVMNSVVAGKADITLIGGSKRLDINEWPLISLYSNEPISDSSAPNNKLWLSLEDSILKYKHAGTVYKVGEPAYTLYYCGDKIYKWNGSAFVEMKVSVINDLTTGGTTVPLSAEQGKALKILINGLSSDVDTLSAAVQGKQAQLVSGTNIKTINGESVLGAGNIQISAGDQDTLARYYIDVIQGKFDALITAMTNYSFAEGKSDSMKVGSIDWNDPTPTPPAPAITSPTNGSTVNVGINTGSGVTKTITVKGENLTKTLNLSVTGTGFSVSTASISAASANSGATITMTYNGTSASASGTLVISSSEVNISVSLTASYSVSPMLTSPTNGEDFNVGSVADGSSTVTKSLTIKGSNLTKALSIAVTEGSNHFSVSGGSVTAIAANNGTTVDVTFTHSSSVQQAQVSTGKLTISSEEVSVVVDLIGTKMPPDPEPEPGYEPGYVTDGLVLHLDGKYQGNDSGYWTERLNDNSYGTRKFQFTTGVTSESDGVKFSDYGQMAIYNGVSGTNEDKLEEIDDLPSFATHTIEVCFTPLSGFYASANHDGNNYANRVFFMTSHDNDICAMIQGRSGTNPYPALNAFCFRSYGSNDPVNVPCKIVQDGLSETSVPSTISIRMASDVTDENINIASTHSCLFMKNGIAETIDTANAKLGIETSSGATMVVGGMVTTVFGDNRVYMACAKIHAIRIYNKRLTQSEMLQNQKEDNRRYNLGITALND